ncbi:MAG: hypothetical protein BroJett018_09760 [Chloroflexota bacterium]|nr:hypothetical protein [Chloroflexota bacterium]NOG62609.1 hypothetical protein [Chloroflexota bacterium]GIK63182.1 MAG: hypothetical protein BroJett018_09760 [Chloroflexota bacterium]
MSNWEQLSIGQKITRILEDVSLPKEHHFEDFGRPFLTVYQIAIEFEKRYPEDAKVLRENGDFIYRYFANELSQRIKNKTISHIEPAWLSAQSIQEIAFHYGEPGQGNLRMEGFSMFRLRRD